MKPFATSPSIIFVSLIQPEATNLRLCGLEYVGSVELMNELTLAVIWDLNLEEQYRIGK